jgi:hypothetical protein
MVMTEWMKSVQAALKTIPANTPNRLKAAMAKAKLTYKKKGSSSSSSSAPHGMKQTHRRHRRSGKGRGRSKRHGTRRGSSRRYRGGSTVALSPANYVGDDVGSSGINLQMKAAMNSI